MSVSLPLTISNIVDNSTVTLHATNKKMLPKDERMPACCLKEDQTEEYSLQNNPLLNVERV